MLTLTKILEYIPTPPDILECIPTLPDILEYVQIHSARNSRIQNPLQNMNVILFIFFMFYTLFYVKFVHILNLYNIKYYNKYFNGLGSKINILSTSKWFANEKFFSEVEFRIPRFLHLTVHFLNKVSYLEQPKEYPILKT